MTASLTIQHDTTPQRAIIYCRVSSAKQVEEGHGLESQATRCREYAKRKGYQLIRTFHEKGVSGGALDRPSFNELIAFLEAQDGAGIVVIIDDISRFARDIESHWTLRRTLKDLGGKLESPSINFGEDSDSVLIENMLASVSQHQRQKNAEQTRNRMRARAMSGYWCYGGVPAGYKYARVAGHGNMLVRDELLASIVAEALEGFANGRFQSQSEVKAFLESQPAFAGRYATGQVRYQEVIRMLSRPLYAGYIEAPSLGISRRKGHHEGLITLETYTRIQDRIKEGARVAYRKDLNLDFPLRGFVLCADCDGPLTSCWSKSKTGKKHPYYMCFTKVCKSYRKSIRKVQIEGDFGQLMQGVAPSTAVLSGTRRMFTDIWDARLAQAKDHAVLYKRKAAEIDKQVDSLLTRLVDATEPRVIGAYETKIARLEEEKLVLEEKAAGSAHPQLPFAQMFELAM